MRDVERRSPVLFAILALVVLPELELRTQTGRADWYASAGLKVDVKGCEKFLVRTEKLLGVRVPRFQYIRVRTPDEVYVRTGIYVGGIALKNPLSIVSTEACSKHEVVHLASFQLARAERFFEEGLACMLGGDFDWVDRWNARHWARYDGESYPMVNNRLTFDRNSYQVRGRYALADSWMRHLVRRRGGMPAVISFFQASGSLGGAHAAFLEVYGVELEDEFDRWLYGKKVPLQQ